MQRLSVVVFACWIIVGSSSCVNIKNFQYLQGNYDTARISKVKIPEPVIQKGDLLGITIYSDDPLATEAVVRQSSNTGMSLSVPNSGNNVVASVPGYLVNQDGYLQMYKIGTIHAAGLTKEQLADTLAYLYAKHDLLKNPYAEVRFLNYKITVIGEVFKPGPYTIPVDKVNAFEAIGLAGDVTQYGRRDNILVVRETNGVRHFGRLNLKDPNVFLSPYYYLQQNDLLIVDVYKNKSTINNLNTIQTISMSASIVSMLALIYSIIERNN